MFPKPDPIIPPSNLLLDVLAYMTILGLFLAGLLILP